MSPHDSSGKIHPEEAHALDALIASQTDTSIDEEKADRLLSFLESGESRDGPEGGLVETAPSRMVPIPETDASQADTTRTRQPIRIAASVVLALALGAAALLLFHARSDAPTEEGPAPLEPKSPYIAHEVSPPSATLALQVSGWSKKRVEQSPAGDPILFAWSGRWVADLETEDLLEEMRDACAAVLPWPTRPVHGDKSRSISRVLEPVLAMPGLSQEGTLQRRALLGATWLISEVESGSLSRQEVLEPARVLMASDGKFRADLVRCFRESRIRFDKLLTVRKRKVSEHAAALCGALGSSRGTRTLARASLGAQRAAIVEAVRTGDEASLGFAIDLLLRAHRFTPSLDQRRIDPLETLEGESWRLLLHLLEARASSSSSFSERNYLDGLRSHLSSKS